ncbi:MAG: HNH endonuclease [Paraclostridium sp.]
MDNKYKEYLKSDEWKNIRELVLKRDNRKCVLCGSDDRLHIHHKTYKNIFNEIEHLDDLITLCNKCHANEHNKFMDFLMIDNRLILSKNSLKSVENSILYSIFQYKQHEYRNGDVSLSFDMDKSYFKKIVQPRWITPKSLELNLKSIIKNQSFESMDGTYIKFVDNMYLVDKNTIHVDLNDLFLEYFINLDKEYTQLPLLYLKDSKSTIRNKMYELIYMYGNNGKIIMTYDKIKFLLGKENSDKYHITERIKIAVGDIKGFRIIRKHHVYMIFYTKIK